MKDLHQMSDKLRQEFINDYIKTHGEAEARAVECFLKTTALIRITMDFAELAKVSGTLRKDFVDSVRTYVDYVVGNYLTLLKLSDAQVEHAARSSDNLLKQVFELYGEHHEGSSQTGKPGIVIN